MRVTTAREQVSLNEALYRYAMPRQDAYDLVTHEEGYAKEPPTTAEMDQTPVRPGPWYHSSPGLIEPGTVLDPQDPYHPNRYNYWQEHLQPRDRQVFMHHDPARTEVYGDHLYEVEPLDEGPYAYNGEDKAGGDGDGYASPRARVIREIKREPPPEAKSFADAMAMMARIAARPDWERQLIRQNTATDVNGETHSLDWGGSKGYAHGEQSSGLSPTCSCGWSSGSGSEAAGRRGFTEHIKSIERVGRLLFGAVPQTLHRGLSLDLDSPEGTFGAASPQLRKILQTTGPESPEFLEELLRHGTGSFWTNQRGFAEGVNPTGGNGLQVVMSADWDGNNALPPEGFDKMMNMPGFDASMIPSQGPMGEVRLKPGKQVKVKSVQVRKKGDPSFRELLRAPMVVTARAIHAMPMRDAWDDEIKDQESLRYYSPELRDIQQDPTPDHGWIHTSPRPHAIGDVLTPRGDVGTSEYQEYYNRTDHGSRRNWVWMSPKPQYDDYYPWATPDDYVYEVEPTNDGPHPWNGSGGDGYVAEQARVKGILRQPKIPNAKSDGPPAHVNIVLPPWEQSAPDKVAMVLGMSTISELTRRVAWQEQR